MCMNLLRWALTGNINLLCWKGFMVERWRQRDMEGLTAGGQVDKMTHSVANSLPLSLGILLPAQWAQLQSVHGDRKAIYTWTWKHGLPITKSDLALSPLAIRVSQPWALIWHFPLERQLSHWSTDDTETLPSGRMAILLHGKVTYFKYRSDFLAQMASEI